jgi:hypothetical protein
LDPFVESETVILGHREFGTTLEMKRFESYVVRARREHNFVHLATEENPILCVFHAAVVDVEIGK